MLAWKLDRRTFPLRTWTSARGCTLLLAWHLAWGVGLVAPAVIGAQEADRAASNSRPISSPATGLVADVLRRAMGLEGDQRWGEALSLYEDTLRANPDVPQLRERLQVARFHYDVRRRYADSSFTNAVDRMSDREALDLYGEVLFKIDSHYVESPDWSLLLQRGAENLLIALQEKPFRSHHLSRTNAAEIRRFQQQLEQRLPKLHAKERQDAVAEAHRIAHWAAQAIQLPLPCTILEFMCGASASLDTYSTFLTGSQLDEVYQQIEGNFVGLGVELQPRDRDLLIVHVIPGGPAAAQGLRAGDRIVGVDQSLTDQVSPNQVADLLRGPEGTVVTVHVVRRDGAREQVAIRRRRVEVPSVDEVKLVDATQGIGYLRINSFQKTTSRDMDAALWKLHRNGMRALIIDLRHNPGGLLEESVEVADRFVDEGMIVSTRGRSARENRQYTAGRTGTWQIPLVVLIDGDSASASEIFAAAMRDHGRAVVVGERSYGKGSVQGIFPLASTTAGLRLTTAKFYAPLGQRISGEGVTPHVPVPTTRLKPESAMLDGASDDGASEEVDSAAARIDVGLWTAIETARQRLVPPAR